MKHVLSHARSSVAHSAPAGTSCRAGALLAGALVVLATPSASAETSCRATALLEGDATLVDALDAALHRRGIATTATATATTGCRAARARITRQGGSIIVSVVDPDGRRSERRLADLDAAASLIESWARPDLNAALLVGEEPAALASEPARVDAAPIVRSRARTRDPLTLVAAGEASMDTDGGAWLGARATGCARVGRVCAGITGRTLARDAHRSYDLLASIDLPLAVGRRLVLVTGGGAGPGWFATSATGAEGSTASTTAGVRLDAHASISFAVAPHVALHAGVSLGASPWAPGSTTNDEAMTSTGEPSILFRGDVGLRIGAP